MDASSTHPLFISVNLSARQLTSANLADTVAAILSEEEVDGSRLRLEITESAMMKNPAASIETLNRLRKLGLTICIDDFGTGYSVPSCPSTTFESFVAICLGVYRFGSPPVMVALFRGPRLPKWPSTVVRPLLFMGAASAPSGARCVDENKRTTTRRKPWYEFP